MAIEQKLSKTKAQSGKEKRSGLDFKLPLIGHFPIAKQLNYLGIAVGAALLLTAVAGYINDREAGYRTGYVLQATDIELYANQLNSAAALAVSGDGKAFENFR
jgi:twitching motility protein PilJ